MKTKNKKIIIIPVLIVVLISSLFFYYYKYYKKNHINKSPGYALSQKMDKASGAGPGAKTVPNAPLDKSADNSSSDTVKSTSSAIAITLNAAGQDNSNEGPLIIKAIISGADGGSCLLNLANPSSGATQSETNTISWNGTFYQCNFSIPFTSLSKGSWNLTLSATQNNKTTNINKVIEIK